MGINEGEDCAKERLRKRIGERKQKRSYEETETQRRQIFRLGLF